MSKATAIRYAKLVGLYLLYGVSQTVNFVGWMLCAVSSRPADWSDEMIFLLKEKKDV